jgi:hypothetical protein
MAVCAVADGWVGMGWDVCDVIDSVAGMLGTVDPQAAAMKVRVKRTASEFPKRDIKPPKVGKP